MMSEMMYPSWFGTAELDPVVSILGQMWRIGQVYQLIMVPTWADRMRFLTSRLASKFVESTDRSEQFAQRSGRRMWRGAT